MNNITLLTVISFILFMGRGLTGPISSLYVESLGANYFVIGLLSTVSSLTSVVSSYLWGRYSDRLARRKALLVGGMAGSTLVTMGTSFIPGYLYMFPLRVIGSISQAAHSTTSLALMGDALEQRSGRGRSMGLYRGLGSLGFALMAFIAGGVVDRSSLRMPFILAGALSVLGFAVSLFVQEAPAPSQPSVEGNASTTPSVAAKGQYLPFTPLLLSTFLWSLAFSAVLALWSNYLVGELNYTTTAMSQLWALAALSEFPMMIVAGWLSDRVGRLPMLSVGLASWTAVLLGYVAIPVYPWILFLQLGRGFALATFVATSMTYATEVTSQAGRGRASGLYSAARGLGAVLGGTVGGSLTQLLGFAPMILTSAGITLGGAIYLAGAYVQWRKRSCVATARR
jgi:MFS family permease